MHFAAKLVWGGEKAETQDWAEANQWIGSQRPSIHIPVPPITSKLLETEVSEVKPSDVILKKNFKFPFAVGNLSLFVRDHQKGKD